MMSEKIMVPAKSSRTDKKNCGACQQCLVRSLAKWQKPEEAFEASALYQAEVMIYTWYIFQTARRA